MKTLSLVALLFSAGSAFAQPCPYNEADYLAYNPDIYAAVARGDYTAGQQHYVNYGYRENRRYNASCYNGGANPAQESGSNLYPCEYNEQDYLDFNQDIYAAVARGNYSSGKQHFIAYGFKEGRRYNRYCDKNGPTGEPMPRRRRPGPVVVPVPNPMPPSGPVACAYNEQDYLAYNRDIYAAVARGDYASGQQHYANYGFQENRRFNRRCINGGADPMKASSSSERPCLFNEQDYLDFNQDIYAAVARGNYSSGKQHFIAYGFKENRRINRSCR